MRYRTTEYIIVTQSDSSAGATSFNSDVYTDTVNRSLKFIWDPIRWDKLFGAGNWVCGIRGHFSIGHISGVPVMCELYNDTDTAQIDEQELTSYVGGSADYEYCDVEFAGSYPTARKVMKARVKRSGTGGVVYISNNTEIYVRQK